MPGGRPSKLDAPIVRPDGRTTTVSERIIDLLGTGMYLERAAAECQVAKSTIYGWLEVASQARVGAALGRRLRKHELRCVQFSDAVAQAEARHEATALGVLERLGRGGIPVEKVTEKYERQLVVDQEGRTSYDLVLIERRVTTEHTLPSVAALTWKLSRRYQERWGDRIEVHGPDNADARALATELRTYLGARHAGAIEATATELAPADD